MATTQTPAGWYPDPAGGGGQRWWDGYQWATNALPAGMTPVRDMQPGERLALATIDAEQAPGRGKALAALICGIVGVVIGLVPILGLLAFALGIVAIVLGVIAYKTGRRVGHRQGRAAIVLGVASIVLSIIGYVIVSNAFNDFSDSVDCLSNARTAAQIDACD